MNKINEMISVVIPVYNSEKTIVQLLEGLKQTLSHFSDYEIILINDCSSDNSFGVIREYVNNSKKLIAVDLQKNVGQQKATFLGLKHAKGDYIVVVDDDLAHAPDDILMLYDKTQHSYDVVYGINKCPMSKSFIRNFGSKVRDFTFNSITKKPKDIKVSSFRIINKKTNDKIITANTDYIYISIEILKHTTILLTFTLTMQREAGQTTASKN